jgi:hypothetical protein
VSLRRKVGIDETIRWFARRLDGFDLKQPARQRISDAGSYWAETGGGKWRSDSHWRGSDAFVNDEDWLAVGAEHVSLTRRLLPAVYAGGATPRTIEWGVGGGANAVHFAALASEFVAVDVAQESLDESARQVGATCDTPFQPVLIDVAHPEAVLDTVSECDLFLCFYVFELLPTAEYALRLLSIARQLLLPGGAAVIQVKYSTSDRWTRSRVRDYRENLANMTTFAIDEFWLHAERAGFQPRSVALVPKNRLDERYAYFALIKPLSDDAP